MPKFKLTCIFFVVLSWAQPLTILKAQSSKTNVAFNGKTVPEKIWQASWICSSADPGKEYGVYYFRKKIELITKPEAFMVKVSADNRYKLYVNGTLVSIGPARGDLFYWNYETVDLAPYLSRGVNDVCAIVWNDGDYRPEAQISLRTAFIIQGEGPAESVVNSGRSWKCLRSAAYSPLPGIGYPAWYIVDPGEIVDMKKMTKGWLEPAFDDNDWPAAKSIDRGKPKGTPDAAGWMLVRSSLPQMERTLQRTPALRNAEGIPLPDSFPLVKKAVTIPPHTYATLLLDQTFLTTAYLTLKFSGGKDAGISLTYAEAPFDQLNAFGGKKGNRNQIQGKVIAGRRDSIVSDGSEGQTFETRYWRTFRYIRLSVFTQDSPLIIDDIFGTFTAYPFRLNSSLETEDEEMKKILDIGWRTARLDALETYMDCPYYEQLQYIGDTRIQALISYYNSGDDRLARNAINQMDHSRIAEGLTFSRHPSFTPQVISTFSLWYIGVLHDYWMYRPDNDFIKDKLPGERSVLDFFNRYQQADGSLRNVPYWNFVDWAKGKNWKQGVPPIGKSGGSAILDLQLLLAYQLAADMEAKLGLASFATLYKGKAEQLKKSIREHYWDRFKQLYADNEDKDLFSQHTNSLAILAGLGNKSEWLAISKKILKDSSLTACTIYFKYYLHQALVKAGLGNDYMNWLDIWRKNISNGLTTWAETSDLDYTRSDCHAWGASPNIEFYRTVLGIDSYAPGFTKVKIEPHLGNSSWNDIGGEIPHPKGKISVKYLHKANYQDINIVLPSETSGILIWKGVAYPLVSGENKFKYVGHVMKSSQKIIR
ncbi:alpha-rhamnosidase [Mucilaginibacter sp. cycad4]|uniref:alpha-L-rhamnosidase-related protein n=1 Tax=Mucilaginibacter sp. cycad4 TaxID=3342096 RepID=UPI002AAB7389|nr:alpha-rhamnosidase [Mucilaginibacter gossypii]WPV01935.1 alpha-rhamnosidase [Mucilaginibacter gossypii]